VRVGLRADGDPHRAELGERVVAKAASIRLRRIAICSALPTSNRQSGGTTAPASTVRSSTSSVAGVASSSKYQAIVTDASSTRLTGGLR